MLERWTVYDSKSDAFYVNIGTPAKIAVIQGKDPTKIARWMDVPSTGPHGLDIEVRSGRLFCACDSGVLSVLDIASGKQIAQTSLSGLPDVIFFNQALQQLYVAIGDPGCIDVFDTSSMRKIETADTELGAHTIGFSEELQKVYAFLPASHRAAVFRVHQ